MTNATIHDVAAFFDAQPCNSRHSNAPVGTRAYFDAVEERRYKVEPHIPRFAEFHHWYDREVLELGCGIGVEAVNFARAGAQVVAIDISKRSIELAVQRATRYNVLGSDSCFFFVGDVETLDQWLVSLIDGWGMPRRYDLVFSFGVIHHTPNSDAVIRQARQFIKPTGEFRLMLYHRWSWKALLIALGLAQSEARAGVPIARQYTKRQARALLERNGFEVTSMEVTHIFPWRVRDYIEKRYVKAWPWKAVPAPLFRWLERRIGWHLLIKARPA